RYFLSWGVDVDMSSPIAERSDSAQLVRGSDGDRLRIAGGIIDGTKLAVVAGGSDDDDAGGVSVRNGAKQRLASIFHAEAHIDNVHAVTDAPFNAENNIGDKCASVVIECFHRCDERPGGYADHA